MPWLLTVFSNGFIWRIRSSCCFRNRSRVCFRRGQGESRKFLTQNFFKPIKGVVHIPTKTSLFMGFHQGYDDLKHSLLGKTLTYTDINWAQLNPRFFTASHTIVCAGWNPRCASGDDSNPDRRDHTSWSDRGRSGVAGPLGFRRMRPRGVVFLEKTEHTDATKWTKMIRMEPRPIGDFPKRKFE